MSAVHRARHCWTFQPATCARQRRQCHRIVAVAAPPVDTWTEAVAERFSQSSQQLEQYKALALERLDAVVSTTSQILHPSVAADWAEDLVQRGEQATAGLEASTRQAASTLQAAVSDTLAGAKVAEELAWVQDAQARAQQASSQVQQLMQQAASTVQTAVSSLLQGGLQPNDAGDWVQKIVERGQQLPLQDYASKAAEGAQRAVSASMDSLQNADYQRLAEHAGKALLSAAQQAAAPFDLFAGNFILNSLFMAVIILLCSALLVTAPRQ